MVTLKCKMCGGDIEMSLDKDYGVCQFCGSTTTLPKLEDEQRAGMFNRGNSLRMRGEFDKAADVFERIIEQDEADAEAHWCLALCRYGIEYVEDPKSGERIPTCNRASFESILNDVDYLAALEHSDGYSASLYEAEAKKIADIQKNILAISRNEEPFDIFICYKETTDGGSRTKDSALAQDIYYQLSNEGYKVFFSRITLEDRLGHEYEPYIFAALNSAMVMLVVGTSSENFNAVWVKNEWSRFLTLMKNDKSRVLIPCYRDMDPYDLPDELAMLQSQDMGKIGFLQDISRGIKKILEGTSANKQNQEKDKANFKADLNSIDRLLSNAETYMRLSKYDSAISTYEQITQLYPEDYRGWWGLIISYTRNLSILDQESKTDAWYSYVKNNLSYNKMQDSDVTKNIEADYMNYKNRCWDQRTRQTIDKKINSIEEEIRRKQNECENYYSKANSLINANKFEEAAGNLLKIIGYKDSEKLYNNAFEKTLVQNRKIEELRKEKDEKGSMVESSKEKLADLVKKHKTIESFLWRALLPLTILISAVMWILSPPAGIGQILLFILGSLFIILIPLAIIFTIVDKISTMTWNRKSKKIDKYINQVNSKINEINNEINNISPLLVDVKNKTKLPDSTSQHSELVMKLDNLTNDRLPQLKDSKLQLDNTNSVDIKLLKHVDSVLGINNYFGSIKSSSLKEQYDVKLTNSGSDKINVIKIVREISGLSLNEARSLVDSAPQLVAKNVTLEEANNLKTKLEEAGASVEMC